MINVVHVITRLDAGGSSTNTIETVARLDKNRFRVHLVTGKTYDPDGKILQGLKDRGVDVTFLEDLVRPIDPLRDLKACRRLVDLIKHGQYDIVHTHSSKAGILGRWAARRAGVKHIVHTPHGHVFYGYFHPVVSRMFIWLERMTARFTGRIITLTEKGKRDHIQEKIAPPEKFVPIYSGIDVAYFQDQAFPSEDIDAAFGLTSDDVVFCCVARLDPVKGNLDLVEAFDLVVRDAPRAKLILVGNGLQKGRILDKIKTLRLDSRILLAGHRQDVRPFLARCDVFVLASHNEGMGRVILEAMAMGKPVVATAVGGIPEIVEEGRTGRLVPPGQPRALAEAMTALADDKPLRENMGRNARTSVNDRFSLTTMVERIAQVYDELLQTDL